MGFSCTWIYRFVSGQTLEDTRDLLSCFHWETRPRPSRLATPDARPPCVEAELEAGTVLVSTPLEECLTRQVTLVGRTCADRVALACAIIIKAIWALLPHAI